MKKRNKAFTLVELMVVVAVIAVLATVSIIGYKSYIKRENINATITEAEQVREILISQIVADSDAKIVINLSHNDLTLTYENGVLQFSSSDPAQATDSLEEIEEFDAAIRAAFPSLSSLPGTLTYEGNDVYYHHLSIENIHQLIDNGSITEDDLVTPKAPYEANDVAINIYTLEYITFDEKGKGTNGYDQIQFNIAVSSVNLELENAAEGKTDDERTDVVKVKYFINPIGTSIDVGFVNNNYTSSQANNIVDISIGEPDSSGYGYITLCAKNATVNGPLLIKFTAGNIGRTLRLKVFEKGRQTIAVPKLLKRFEYKYSGTYTNGVPQTVTPADCGIGDNLINNEIVGYKITSINKELVNPGDTITIEFGIIDKDYCWADDFSSDTTKSIVVTLSKLLIPTPTLNHKELIYNGRNQTPTLSEWNVGDFSSYVRISRSGIREAIGDLISRDGKDPGVYFSEFEIINEYDLYFGWKENENSKTLLVPWEIKKLTIKKPTFALINPDGEGYFDYDGNEKVAVITYAGDTEKYINCTGSKLKETNAGDYSVTLSIYSDRNDKGRTGGLIGGLLNSDPPYSDIYEWIDENGNRSSGEIRFVWRINPITIDPPTVKEETIVYDGQPHKPTLIWPEGKNYDNLVTVSSATDAGIHDITISINSSSNNNVAFTGGKKSMTVKMEITKKALTVSDYPSATSNIKKPYTGEKQTVKLSDFGSFDSRKITLYAGNEGLGVQTYTAYFKPTNNYCFAEGSGYKTSADGVQYVTSTWEIIKVKVTKPTLKTNLHLNYNGNDQYPWTTSTIDKRIELSGDVPPQKNHKEGGYVTTVSIDGDSCEWTTGGSASYDVTWFIDKVDPTISPTPQAKNPTYNNGTELALVSPGTAYGGTIYYALGENNTTAPTNDWSTSVPTGGECGKTYYVWYKVVGDNNHNDLNPRCVSSKVSKGENPIMITGTQNSWNASYSSSNQTHYFTAATNGQGEVTYTIVDQPRGNYFTIPVSTEALLNMKGNTPVNTNGYTITIRATAAGNDMYESGYADTTIKVIVNKVQAAFTTPPSAKTGLKYNDDNQELINAGEANAGTIKYAVSSNKDTRTSNLSWGSTIPSKKDAGTYYVWYKIDGDDNVNGTNTTGPLSISIGKGDNSITITDPQKQAIEYNSNSQVTVNFDKATDAKGTATYTLKSQKKSNNQSVSYFTLNSRTLKAAKKTPKGTYNLVITATDPGNNNYSSATKDFNLEVTVTGKLITTLPSLSNSNLTYTGSEITATFDNVRNTTITSGNKGTIPDTYTAHFKANDGYEFKLKDGSTSETLDVDWTIDKADISVSTNFSDLDYSTTATFASDLSGKVTTKGNQTPTIKYCDTENGTYQSSISSFNSLKLVGSNDKGMSVTVYYKITAQYHNDKSGSYTITMSDKSTGGGGTDPCVTGDTLVTLADGTLKQIQNISRGEKVISWSYEKGVFEEDVVSAVWNHGDQEYDVITLSFNDNSFVDVVKKHDFFNVNRNEYVEINTNNYYEFVGESFLNSDGNAIELIDASCVTKMSSCYSLITLNNNNFIANGIVSRTPDPFEGYFDILKEMFSNPEQLQEDIEKYGLYEYSEWEDYISYEDFVAFNAQYFKIMVGKGILTEEDIFRLIELYATE